MVSGFRRPVMLDTHPDALVPCRGGHIGACDEIRSATAGEIPGDSAVDRQKSSRERSAEVVGNSPTAGRKIDVPGSYDALLQLSCSSSQRNLHDGPRLTYSEFLVISYCAVPRTWHPKDWS